MQRFLQAMATHRVCEVLACVAWCMASIVGAELVQSVGTSQAPLVAPVSIPPDGAHAKAAAEVRECWQSSNSAAKSAVLAAVTLLDRS